MSSKDCNVEELKRLLAYDPVTGSFTWRVSQSNAVKIGTEAGSKIRGGILISCKNLGGKYLAHRLAWAYMTGSFPPPGHVIDHRDRNQYNNAFANLRICTQQQNTWNQGLKSTNKTGVKGVSVLRSGKFRATIRTSEGWKNLGNFPDLESAAKVVREARAEYHGEFACEGM